MSWQPIETAPRNKWLLLWNEDAGYWVGQIAINFDPGEPEATHWMPLPAPPIPEPKETAGG